MFQAPKVAVLFVKNRTYRKLWTHSRVFGGFLQLLNYAALDERSTSTSELSGSHGASTPEFCDERIAEV